ncbi:remorin family protein [Actinidia rufa]|uniref:Remorin family protein n=1 Tax=Actinidia rufa TaxID=165716 RepID=A0A7J0E191_9ERIC|nr:remorin family protein [Actinidia rufa]
MKREEAKVTAWENLQIAKAEAAIRKLEMKLEKKRSSSMDRIMKKLRSAQKKAQEMRSSVLTNQSHQVASTSNKVISFRQTSHISSLRSCFTCHACICSNKRFITLSKAWIGVKTEVHGESALPLSCSCIKHWASSNFG